MNKFRAFKSGQSALRELGLSGPGYLCPICRVMFDIAACEQTPGKNDNILTKEHVPPASMGGKVLLLTCKDCNNFAGGKYEGEMARFTECRSNFGDLVTNRDVDFGNLKVELPTGKSIPARVSRKNGRTRIILYGSSKPGAPFDDYLSSLNKSDPISFKLKTRRPFQTVKLDLTLLRSAYLFLVAKFGYCITFLDRINLIRQAILEGTLPPAETFEIIDSNDARKGFLVTPEAVLVCLGPFRVALPWAPELEDNEPPFGYAAQYANQTGRWHDFPTQFEGLYDHLPGVKLCGELAFSAPD